MAEHEIIRLAIEGFGAAGLLITVAWRSVRAITGYLDSRFDQVALRVEERHSEVTTRLDTLNGNVARNVQKINQHDTRIAVAEAKIDDISSR